MNDQTLLCFPVGLCPPPPPSSDELFSTVLEEFTPEFNLNFVLPKGKRTKHQDFALINVSCRDISPSQVCNEDLSPVPDIKDLHGPVWGAGGQACAVVIHLCIMLQGEQGELCSAGCAQPADWPHCSTATPGPTWQHQKNSFKQSRHATKAICFPSCFFNHYINITQKEYREFWAATHNIFMTGNSGCLLQSSDQLCISVS